MTIPWNTHKELIDLLEGIPSLQDRDARDAWLERQLPRRLVETLNTRRSNVPRDDITHILHRLDFHRLYDGSLAVSLLLHDVLSDLPNLGLHPSISRRLHELSTEVEQAAGPPPTTGISPPSGFDEVIIGVNEKVLTGFLVEGLNAGRSVARVSVTHQSGEPANGTGWLIAPRLLITNHHVVQATPDHTAPIPEEQLRKQACSLVAHFGYTGYEAPQSFRAQELAAFDFALDFAIVRLAETSRSGAPLAQWGFLRLVEQQPALPRGTNLNVIQHPRGRVREFALRSNFLVSQVAARARLFYVSDTEEGSSGSPVMDDHWEVVALHRGWDYFKDQYHGQPIRLSSMGLHYEDQKDLPGDVQLKINEGVLIHAILERLPEPLKAEIKAAQRLA